MINTILSGNSVDEALSIPLAPAIGPGDTLYFTDLYRVRRLNGETVETIAGSLEVAIADDQRIARNARFRAPQGLAVDASGVIYVADVAAGLVRRLTPRN